MTEARIYLRVSRGDEAEILKNMKQAALEHVKACGFHLAGLYEEVASGAADDRPAFNDLMKQVRAGEVIVFPSLSRVTRKGTFAALEILRQLETRGVGWHFVQQPFLNYSASQSSQDELVSKIMLTLLAEIDRDYRDRISRATKAALAKKKAGGGRLGRKPGAKDRKPRKKRSPRSLVVAQRQKQSSRYLEAP